MGPQLAWAQPEEGAAAEGVRSRAAQMAGWILEGEG